jgi:Bacterial PH domain
MCLAPGETVARECSERQIGDTVRYRVTSRWQRVVTATVFGVLFFLETGAYFDHNGLQPGELAFTSALLLVMAVFIVRAARSCTLVADDRTVVVRSLIRTRSWRWEEINRFEVETRRMGGFIKYRRRMLGIDQTGGKTKWLPELTCWPATPTRRSWVDDAAEMLNAHLAARTSAVGPAA